MLHNQEFLDLMQNHIINSDKVDDTNRAALQRCSKLMYNMDICDTCDSLQRNYLIKLKDFWNRRLASGWEPPKPISSDITNDNSKDEPIAIDEKKLTQNKRKGLKNETNE